jgi:methylated-DNA-[protein]-cysteine S-methyltransferase
MQRSISEHDETPEMVDVCAPIETPIGTLFVAGHETVVSAVGRSASAVEASVRGRLGRAVRHEPALPGPLAQAVAAQLQGDDSTPLTFDLGGLPELDRAVLRAALAIPRGQVRSYGQLAMQIGKPRASKDVGVALGQNPIPVLIPCHRIVYSDGRIGGYIFGSRAKRTLLVAEGAPVADVAQLALDLRVA